MSNSYDFSINGKNNTQAAFKQINTDLKRTNSNVVSMFDTGTRKGRNFRQNIQQVGFQVQDFAVQVGGGTNALQAFGQQGSQLAGIFGPTGAIVGAVIAIGSVLGVALAPALLKSTDAVKELSEVMEKLNSVVRKGDNGIIQFTEQISELSAVGVSAFGAEIEASIIRAEQAAGFAAASLLDKINELDAGFGVFNASGIKDYVDALNNTAKSTNVNIRAQEGFIQTSRELGEQLGLTGEDARVLGKSIIESLANLQLEPTAEGFKDLQLTLSGLVKENENVSEKTKLLISDLNLFFAESRSAAESAEFLRERLAALNDGADVSRLGESMKKTNDFIVALAQELAVARLNLTGNSDEAERLAFALENSFNSFDAMPDTAKTLYEQLKLVNAEQQKSADLEKARAQSQRTIDSLNGAFGSSGIEQQNQLRIEAIQELVLSEAQIQEAGYNNLLELQRDYIQKSNDLRDQQLMDKENAEFAQFEKLLDQAERQEMQIQSITQSMTASMVSMTGQLATQFANAAQEGSSMQKAAFVASQGLAIASTIINTEMAAIAALAPPPVGLGPVAGLPYSQAIRGIGYLSAGLIGAQTIAGAREMGGPVASGRTYLVGERGPELFTPNSSGNIVNNRDTMGALGGSTINATFNVSGNIDESTMKALERNQKKFIRMVNAAQGVPA